MHDPTMDHPTLALALLLHPTLYLAEDVQIDGADSEEEEGEISIEQDDVLHFPVTSTRGGFELVLDCISDLHRSCR